MQRTFIILPEFDKNWKSMGLSDEDLRRLENLILQDPEAGALMQGTGGLRKLRFAFENRGKSGTKQHPQSHRMPGTHRKELIG